MTICDVAVRAGVSPATVSRVFSRPVNPRLTTVRLPMSDAGGIAVRLLLDLVRRADGHAGPVELLAEPVVRASTGAAPEVAP